MWEPRCYHRGMEKKHTLIRLLLIFAGGLLVSDSLFVMTRSNMNLGVLLPMLLGLPLIVIGIFLPGIKKLNRRCRFMKALSVIVTIGYAALALLFCVCFILINCAAKEPEREADALIVLGGGIRGNTPTLTLKYRLDKAKEYLDAHPDCTAVVSGGRGGDEIVTEASVMREWLISNGISPERIIAEEESKSTKENFEFSKRLIDDKLGKDAVVMFVTTRFHVFRAERVAAKLGIEAEGIPAKGVWYITFNDYLRESLAIAAYWITGRI